MFKTNKLFITAAALCALCTHPVHCTLAKVGTQIKEVCKWKEHDCLAGKCTMQFPTTPDHLSEKMRVPEGGFDLTYDAYVSTLEERTIFLLLVAQYPPFVDEKFARKNLEHFLNGMLMHNPNNQLIFADLTTVDGHEALDFFIRTGGLYFKGRALMVQNQLFLMAMECEVQNYDEANYNRFVNSFQLR